MPEFYLDYLQGARAGVAERFDADVVRVGRNHECELVFDEMGVSWEHAEIRHRDGAFWIIDRGSTNGTFLNEERAHNARLKPGDSVRFGKKGPVARFRLDPAPSSSSSGDAPPLPASFPLVDRPRRAKRRRLPSEIEVPVYSPEALDGPDPGLRHSDLPSAPPRRVEGGVGNAVVLFLGALVCGCLVLLALLYMDHRALGIDLGHAERRAGAAEVERDQLRGELEVRLARARETAAAEAREAALAEARGLERRAARLERDLAEAQQERDARGSRVAELRVQIDHLRRQLANPHTAPRPAKPRAGAEPAPPGLVQLPDWNGTERRYGGSVLFIATRLIGRTRDGKEVPLHAFGAGFVVSDQGHVLTNKHVIQPWKFLEMGERLAREGISVVEDSYEVHAWRGGTQVARVAGGPLDPQTGFSTRHGSLELVRTAPDKWFDVPLSGEGSRIVRVHEPNGDEDLALLRVSGPAARGVLPLELGRSDQLSRRDDVLLLGFPGGPQVLESGAAKTAGVQGRVRKLERTILVSAPMLGGTSGGPLIDRSGRVVGISTRVVEGTEPLGSCLRIEHGQALLHGGAW